MSYSLYSPPEALTASWLRGGSDSTAQHHEQLQKGVSLLATQ